MKLVHVVGARPNYMKTAPLMAAMEQYPDCFEQILVHTGQHYDYNMSAVFFEELQMRCPDEFLNIGSGTHAEQTARAMLGFEPVLRKHQPDWVVVVGDVNSTLACALVAVKCGVRVAHVEAGLRSGDRGMPEEINRILTDQLADALFTPSRECRSNLAAEGISGEKIHFVGNVMIDTLARLLPKARERPILREQHLEPKGYLLVTLHRPSNVDNPETLMEILAAIDVISERIPIVFPVHPRTRHRIEQLQRGANPRVRLMDPLGYLDFVALMDSARVVLTDSGGVQEETTYLGIPCLTARPNTERPVTIECGTNRLVASQRDELSIAMGTALSHNPERHPGPELWDGCAAGRITALLRVWASGTGHSAAAGAAGQYATIK